MTEIEQAIKEYDILIKGYEDDLLSDRYSDIVKEEFKRQRDIFLIGREALKEKAEREKGCECFEYWARIEDTNGNYFVSNLGRIKSTDKYHIRKDGKPIFTNGKILKLSKDTKGYLRVPLEGKTIKVHRAVAKAFIPNPYGFLEVNHINGDKTDNRVENLEWCNRKQNMEHAFASGLIDSRSRLTKDDYNKMFELRKNDPKTYTYKRLSEIYGMSNSHIYRVLNGQKCRKLVSEE